MKRSQGPCCEDSLIQEQGAATKPRRPALQKGHTAGFATEVRSSRLRAQPVHTVWQQPAIITFALASKQMEQVRSTDEAPTLSAMVLSMLTLRACPAALYLLQDARLLLLPLRGRLLTVLQGLLPATVQLLVARLLMLP